ncbi:RNA polymerase sigma factor [Rhodoflexus caldus]|jgi:RNA polymerase sigma-70 factor (ECF subfamily)|uniref:RNA polymerase sigma factor n=1 Tax=Rhodoflexus caldus TaxID=2891236 RepID=UPI00202A325B|nr:sigma-70 family RNA polymerase sigma factor [Rhodoflexus caldus]
MHQSDEQIQQEALILEQAKNNPELFGYFYEKYYRQVFLFINRRVGDSQITADLCSQVFLKAMIRLEKYTHKGLPFSAWLYRIATNQVNEFYRHTQRKRVVSIETEDIKRFFAEAGEDKKQEQTQVIQLLFNELDEEEVALLELRFFEDRPFKEIAFILEQTENNVKVRTHRILEKLRKIAKNIAK